MQTTVSSAVLARALILLQNHAKTYRQWSFLQLSLTQQYLHQFKITLGLLQHRMDHWLIAQIRLHSSMDRLALVVAFHYILILELTVVMPAQLDIYSIQLRRYAQLTLPAHTIFRLYRRMWQIIKGLLQIIAQFRVGRLQQTVRWLLLSQMETSAFNVWAHLSLTFKQGIVKDALKDITSIWILNYAFRLKFRHLIWIVTFRIQLILCMLSLLIIHQRVHATHQLLSSMVKHVFLAIFQVISTLKHSPARIAHLALHLILGIESANTSIKAMWQILAIPISILMEISQPSKKR